MKQHLTVLLAAMAVLLLGYGGYHILFADHEYQRLTVAAVAGEVTHTNGAGAAGSASPGDVLGARSTIKVGADGHAMLVAGEGTQLIVEEETSVRALSADRRGVEVELDEGRVKARVQSGARLLAVRAGNETVRTQAGVFQVARDGDGFVRVQTDSGEVDLQGPAGSVALPPGRRIDIDPSGQQTVSDAVMEEILLQIRWNELDDGQIPVEGRTVPHALVAIEGPEGATSLRADAAGSFAASIPIPPGEHRVEVGVADGLGSTRSITRTLKRSEALPVASTEVRFGE